MKAREIMTADPACCLPQDTAQDAAILMRDRDTGVIPVCESTHDRSLAGIVTDRDLCNGVIAEGRDPASVRVEECMTRNPVTCGPDDELEDVLDLMSKHQVRRVPIIEQSVIKGIISMADIVRRGSQTGKTRETLRSISASSPNASKPRAKSAKERH